MPMDDDHPVESAGSPPVGAVRDGGAQSPIFSKTYDFLLWLLAHTDRFPKSERFRLGQRLENAAFEFHGHLVAAARAAQPAVELAQADLALERLRLYLRLSHARSLTSERQYRHAFARVAEIGRLLGGWTKSVRLGDRAR